MDLFTLCGRIHLPGEIREKVMDYYKTADFGPTESLRERLKSRDTEARARRELEEILEPDPGKIKMLTYMLLCGADLYHWYEEKGIPEEIFFDTMGCFSRFIEECREKTGMYAFDREWWTGRQISGNLFRIGELEYEMIDDGRKRVSIHIPSDAVLTREKCDVSMEAAESFFARYFPDYRDKDYVCHSWLLAPELKALLPEDSHILDFQRRFRIQEVDYQGQEYVEWVFRTGNARVADYPENTCLQKSMKKYLQEGGKIGNGFGVWIKN